MKHVAIYTTPVCKYCKMAKEFFSEHNIPYTEYNVVADRTKLEEMVNKTGQRGVPVITVDDAIVVGFNEPKLRALLLT